MAKKWVPLDGKQGRALMAELEMVEVDGQTVPRYKVWPADCPEPEHSPFSFKPETLRTIYKPEDEGGE